MVESLTILGGVGRDGQPEPVERVEMRMGDMVSIVGPTGSGKSTLIDDIELLAEANTPSGRRILIDGCTPPARFRHDPAHNPVALITQHTSFLSDLPVEEFLSIHARIRSSEQGQVSRLVEQVLVFANQLTGEPVRPGCRMTEMSGGQTRALLIADATVICNTPIILLDEVENAGIHRSRALELLRGYRKIFIFVTHDPRITLLSDYRIVMQGGSMRKVLHTDEAERRCAAGVSRLDEMLGGLRERLRNGERLSAGMLEGLACDF
ncbi:ATP-binding cassette domain-containing protein [bacterium]|nr:ATP-binding cassette domain-containing protein [bacterium]